MSDIKSFEQREADNSNEGGFICDNKRGSRIIFVDDLDELTAITTDLKVLTYLKVLVQENFASGYVTAIFDFQSKDEINMYLLELQIDKVKELESVMEKICQ